VSALSIVTVDPDLAGLASLVLRQPVHDVDAEDSALMDLCRKLAADMFELMYAADGAALAAPQVGVSLPLVVMDPAGIDFGPHVLISPVIEHASEAVESGSEGCLSLPRRMGEVCRSRQVRVRALDLQGGLQHFEAEGWLARILQHEIDHLHGVLYPDRLKAGQNLRQVEPGAHRRAVAAMRKVPV
jgi:peptide deformylase